MPIIGITIAMICTSANCLNKNLFITSCPLT